MDVKDGLPATDFSRKDREWVKNVVEGTTVPDGLPATNLSRMNREWVKAVVDEAGGGSGDIEVEALSVTENGTYTADEGKAYSPVSVTVPQTTVESLSVTENGTYTAPEGKAYSPVTVSVSAAPALGSYKVVMGQFTPTTTGDFTIDVTVTDTISAVKWGVVWLDDGSVASNYSETSIGLASSSPVTGGYSCIDCMNNSSHQAQVKTAYGIEIKKQDAHTFRFHYRSYNGWLGQPETYNYFGIYTV